MTGTPNALSQLSGEGITAAQNAAFASGRMFDSLMMDQGAFWRSGETADSEGVTFREAPLAYAAEKKKPAAAAFKALKAPPPAYQPRTWRVWTGGFGGVQSFNGDAIVGSADARTSAAGGAMGFDYQVDPTRLVGVAVGGSESHFSVPDRATSGNLLGGHVGAYGVATWGALYAAGILSYSRFDNDVRRTIAGVGPTETATGRFASDLLRGAARSGTQLCVAVAQRHAVRRGADLDALAARLYRDEYRCRPARDSRADLSVADDDVAADLPRRPTRHPPGTGERHGLVAVPASGLGARVQSRSLDRRLVRVGAGYAVRG